MKLNDPIDAAEPLEAIPCRRCARCGSDVAAMLPGSSTSRTVGGLPVGTRTRFECDGCGHTVVIDSLWGLFCTAMVVLGAGAFLVLLQTFDADGRRGWFWWLALVATLANLIILLRQVYLRLAFRLVLDEDAREERSRLRRRRLKPLAVCTVALLVAFGAVGPLKDWRAARQARAAEAEGEFERAILIWDAIARSRSGHKRIVAFEEHCRLRLAWARTLSSRSDHVATVEVLRGLQDACPADDRHEAEQLVMSSRLGEADSLVQEGEFDRAAEIYLDLGEPGRAEEKLREAGAAGALAAVLGAQGRREEGIEILLAAGLVEDAASMMFEAGRLSDAVSLLTDAGRPGALARLLQRAGQPRAAADAHAGASQWSLAAPLYEQAGAHAAAAEAWRRAGQPERGIRLAEEAGDLGLAAELAEAAAKQLAAEPGAPVLAVVPLYRRAGRLYRRAGRKEDAVRQEALAALLAMSAGLDDEIVAIAAESGANVSSAIRWAGRRIEQLRSEGQIVEAGELRDLVERELLGTSDQRAGLTERAGDELSAALDRLRADEADLPRIDCVGEKEDVSARNGITTDTHVTIEGTAENDSRRVIESLVVRAEILSTLLQPTVQKVDILGQGSNRQGRYIDIEVGKIEPGTTASFKESRKYWLLSASKFTCSVKEVHFGTGQ